MNLGPNGGDVREASVSISKVVAVGLWSVVGLFITAAWVAWAAGAGGPAVLLGLTGCATSAAAATCTIRCYAVCLSRLVRLTAVGSPVPQAPRPRVTSVSG